MTSTLYSVTLSLALLASLALVSLFNLKVLKPTLETLKESLELQRKAAKDQQKLLSQALNLLSSKDPIAYQMVSAVTPEPMDTSVYNGPYMTGEEYQELLNAEARMDELWKIRQEDIED
jgi:hypothetical protein